jgi:hypothetical protein
MALAGLGAVIIWNDIAPAARDAFFEWHARQHMPERLNVPGFNRGRRCIAVDATVEFLTLYEVADLAVLDSETYRTRLANPTPWSLQVMPHFQNNVRGGCRVLYSGGGAQGGFVQTLRVQEAADTRERLLAHVATTVLPATVDAPRITGAHLLVNDAGLSGGQVGQRQGRHISQPDIVVVLEGSTADGVRDAGDRLLGDAMLRVAGAQGAVLRDLYQLEYTLQKLSHGTVPLPMPSP